MQETRDFRTRIYKIIMVFNIGIFIYFSLRIHVFSWIHICKDRNELFFNRTESIEVEVLYPGGQMDHYQRRSNFCFLLLVPIPRGSAIEVSGRVHRDN